MTLRWLALFVLVFISALPLMAAAQETADVQLPEQSDVRIIVDISGSMKETDPQNLRQPAVRLLARILPEGASAGVWTFGQYVNMLVPHREVSDQWREMAIERSEDINSVALRTNLGEAIEVASDGYYTDGDLSRTHFILLTDGKVDISEDPEANAAEEQRILEEVVPGLVEKGATFHPVALSEAADTEFLRALATQSGGRYQIARSADALNLAFLEALNTAVPQEQIPLEGNGFTVDDGVREFTALIFWGETETSATRELELVRPDGETATLASAPENVRWAREAGYDLITVNEPMAGDWRINGELGEGSRVTVVSDLRMVVSPLPTSFSAEKPLAIRIAFFEEQEKITNPDFLGVLDVELTITSEDGRSGTKVLSGDQPPEDGTYEDTVSSLPAPGLYRIDVVADGQTFSRKFSATVGFTVTEGAESAAPTEPVTAPAEEPKPEPQPPEPAAEEPEPAISSPIDVSQVEAPSGPVAGEAPPKTEPQPKPQPQQPEEATGSLPVPLWMMGAGAGGLVLIGGLVWVALRQRSKRQDEQAEAAAERETLEDLEEASEPEPEPEPEVEPEPEDIPEVTEVDSEPEPEIPIADTLADDEPAEPDEEIPELEDVADPSDADTPEEEDVEEFGLEDFDLSEFDDLPDFDENESALPDNDPKKKPDENDQKK
jgi:hypothetical protein